MIVTWSDSTSEDASDDEVPDEINEIYKMKVVPS
jgi:hypothetical protein